MQKDDLPHTGRPSPYQLAEVAVSRRTLLRAAAWTIPAVAVAVATPALAASDPAADRGLAWYWSQFQVGSGQPGLMRIAPQVALETRNTVPPLTVNMTLQLRSYFDQAMTDLYGETITAFTFVFKGTNGESTPDGYLQVERTLPPEALPNGGKNVWVEFRMLSVIANFAGETPFNLPLASISQPNPSIGEGYVNGY